MQGSPVIQPSFLLHEAKDDFDRQAEHHKFYLSVQICILGAVRLISQLMLFCCEIKILYHD
jgi:hypothetical protein